MSLNKIKEIREAQGMSQEELGRRIGTVGTTISRLETGARKLKQHQMEAIARVLRCKPADLIADGLPNVPTDMLISVAGELNADTWRVHVHKDGASTETVPLLPPHKIKNLAASAWRITDDHASWLTPAGSYVITVPVEALRKSPIDGDIVVVRSKEGRMERNMLSKVRVDARGVVVELDEGEVVIGKENWYIGVVVSVYRELV
jgi:transcriptional regulator with XRE-family HTH domain